MEPTIYKPSIYKGAGIYKTGAEGGGGGGGLTWFSSLKWNSNNAWSYNGANECFEQNLYDNGQGLGCMRCFDEINVTGRDKIEFGLNLFLERRSTSNTYTGTIFHQQNFSGVSNGLVRLFRMNVMQGKTDTPKLLFTVPKNNYGDWDTESEILIDLPGDFVCKVVVDYTQNKLLFSVNDVTGEKNLILTSPPVKFSPCFFMNAQNFRVNSFTTPHLMGNEKMYLNGTYMKIDNELIFGKE